MNIKVKAVLLLLSIIIAGNANSQSTNTDSLENILKLYTSDDTVKVNLLNHIACEVSKDSVDKTRSYATQAADLSAKLGYMEGKAESTLLIGISYYDSDKSKAFEYYQSALQIAEEINYKSGVIKCLNNIGIYYTSQNEIQKAIESYQKGIEIASEINDSLALANCWNHLSNLYRTEDLIDKAIEGYKIAGKIFDEKNLKSNAATCFNYLGRLFVDKGNHPLALEYFQRFLKLKEEQNDSSGIYGGTGNIGNVYLSLSDFPKALEYFKHILANLNLI